MDYKLRVVTYNVNAKQPGENPDFKPLLGIKDDKKESYEVSDNPDFIAIAFQEVIGPVDDTVNVEADWTKSMDDHLLPLNYVLIEIGRKKRMVALLYCKQSIRHRVLKPIVIDVPVGDRGHGALVFSMKIMPGGLAGAISKGARLTLICSHFVAHAHNYDLRCQEYQTVVKGAKFDDEQVNNDIFTHDYSIWFGDLNFRINNLSEQQVNDKILKIESSSEESAEIMEELKQNDQLSIARKDKLAFDRFEELLFSFPPTYKMIVGKDDYDLTRVPSWTDRILYRCSSLDQFLLRLTCNEYEAHFDYKLSDHKPVSATFTFKT